MEKSSPLDGYTFYFLVADVLVTEICKLDHSEIITPDQGWQ